MCAEAIKTLTLERNGRTGSSRRGILPNVNERFEKI